MSIYIYYNSEDKFGTYVLKKVSNKSGHCTDVKNHLNLLKKKFLYQSHCRINKEVACYYILDTYSRKKYL